MSDTLDIKNCPICGHPCLVATNESGVTTHYAPIGWEDEKAILEEKVAKLTLTEHLDDDDGELVTDEWAMSLPGAENAMSRNAVTVVWGEPSERIYISADQLQISGTVLKRRHVTRGDVRRLFRALDLELQEE